MTAIAIITSTTATTVNKKVNPNSEHGNTN